MKIVSPLFLIYFGFNTNITAQISSYDLSTVPEPVRKNASVIKRYENILFDVADINKATLKVNMIMTVVNEKGKEALSFVKVTNKFLTLEELEIKVFDANGKQIEKYRKKDLITESYADGLIDDGKTSYISISAPSYPITVEYKYEFQYHGILTYPRYAIQVPGEGVEISSYTAKVPKDLDLRYKAKNIAMEPVVSEDGKYKIYNWTVKNIPPIEYEEGAVTYEHRYPSILLAPNRFRLDDYEGDMTSWNNFGMWYGELKKGADILPNERKVFFQELVKDATSDKEKIKRLYEYLQQNFRYVSIQLGIGGFKPFPADFTDKKKYGDCKGLSNFMQAALNAIGIKSYQALINRDYNDEPVDPKFPCNQFNHVIVCVPQQRDSIWLECTSKTGDFGVLGPSTENRNALLITENGGFLVPTPASTSSANKFSATTIVPLEGDGSGNTTTVIRTTGEYKDQMNDVVEEKKDDQKQFIVFNMGFKQPDEFAINKRESEDVSITSIELQIEQIPEFIAGNKMFLTPRIYKLWSSKLPKSENRKQDFYFSCPFEKTDTTIYILPAGFKEDALPISKNMKCDYATYSTRSWFESNRNAIFSTAKLVLTQHKISAAKYAAVKTFFDEILADGSQKIVIRKE